MLNIKIKSILAMLLVLCLTMGLVACGSSGAKDNCKRAGRMRTRAERTCKKLFFPANRIIKPFFG